MSILFQISRGAVLLTSMALVACYIDVYTTGKFPWQHAHAETPATTPPPEFVNDPAVQPALHVQESATQEQRMFMAGSKSDVAASAIVVQSPAANGQTNTTTTAPTFMSGSKSYGGATGLLPGTLNPPTQANAQADQKPNNSSVIPLTPEANAPGYFLGGGKSPIGMSGRITETMPNSLPTSTQAPASTVSTDKLQFMGGTKSPGPIVMPSTAGSKVPPPPPQTTSQYAPPGTYPGTVMQAPSTGNGSFSPNVSLQQSKPSTNQPAPSSANTPSTVPQFMSGSKSMFGAPPITSKISPPPPVQQAAPRPLQITPKVAPNSSSPYQQATPRFYSDLPVSPAKSY